jgi:ketosteroid isomerase-like protein
MRPEVKAGPMERSSSPEKRLASYFGSVLAGAAALVFAPAADDFADDLFADFGGAARSGTERQAAAMRARERVVRFIARHASAPGRRRIHRFATIRSMRAPILAAVLCLAAASASAQMLDTEVWVGSLNQHDGGFTVSNLENVSQHLGYDNQPTFFPDGTTLVFTSEVADMAETGLGLNAVLYDLRTHTATPLPDAKGFSPTPTADGKQLMLLRLGRVFLHDRATGKELAPLTETKTAGYYNRIDDKTWVLFLNEESRGIALYDPKTKALTKVATGAVTAPYRVVGKRAVTFAAEEPFPAPEKVEPKLVLRQLDLNTKQVTTLATIPFETGGHHVWIAPDKLLMASGNAIYAWSPAHPDAWNVVYRADNPDLQGITRIAVSPAGDRIALVSVPRAETVIRDTRTKSNAALAAHQPDAVVGLMARDARVIAANGAAYDGRDAIAKTLTERFAQQPDLVYVRTPDAVEVARDGATASERGTWTGRWTTPAGAAEMRGTYLASWRGSASGNGTRSWVIQSELFVPLDCSGAGCKP